MPEVGVDSWASNTPDSHHHLDSIIFFCTREGHRSDGGHAVASPSCFWPWVESQPGQVPVETNQGLHSNLQLVAANAPNAGTMEEHATSTQKGGLNQQSPFFIVRPCTTTTTSAMVIYTMNNCKHRLNIDSVVRKLLEASKVVFPNCAQTSCAGLFLTLNAPTFFISVARAL